MLGRSPETFIVVAMCCVLAMAGNNTCDITNTPSVAIVPSLLQREIMQPYVLS